MSGGFLHVGRVSADGSLVMVREEGAGRSELLPEGGSKTGCFPDPGMRPVPLRGSRLEHAARVSPNVVCVEKKQDFNCSGNPSKTSKLSERKQSYREGWS